VIRNRPAVLAVTRDPSAQEVISIAERVAPPPAGRPTTFVALWGSDYWALAYAQAFEGRLPGLDLVDHNANFEAILARGNRLLTFSKTFHLRPLSWWEHRLGDVWLSSAALEIVEIATSPPIAPDDVPQGPSLDLGNGISIRSAHVARAENGGLVLTVYWQAQHPPTLDYSVAVHLVARDPPAGAEDVLSQADQTHPVYGWYPVSRWRPGEIVCDHYLMHIPAGTRPLAVRIAMYRVDDAGGFVNTPWLSLPLPERWLDVGGS